MGRAGDTFRALLEERMEAGADVAAIDERIWKLFGERWCVLFTDMAGFSRRSARAGIVPFLMLIHQMRSIAGPIWERHSGLVLKDIADSQLVLFRDPSAALRACVAVQRAIAAHNEPLAESDRIYLGCGLGWGDVLKLGDSDVYGVEVNLAAKLGEDLAGPYDIFLTPACAQELRESGEARVTRVKGGRLSSAKLGYYRAEYAMAPKDPRPKARSQRVRSK